MAKNMEKTGQSCLLTYNRKDFFDEKQIGTGGYAEIFSATNIHDNERYCLKVFRDFPEVMEFFNRELKFMEKVPNHANIVKLYGHIKETDQPPVLVMELEDMDLECLCKKISLNNTITKNEASLLILDLFSGVAEALIELESCKIVHTDLDIKNILVNHKNWSVKITDFGLCRRYTDIDNCSHNTLKKDGKDERARKYLFSPAKVNDPGYEYKHEDDIYQVGISLCRAVFLCVGHSFNFKDIRKKHIVSQEKGKGNEFVSKLMVVIDSLSPEDQIGVNVATFLKNILTSLCGVEADHRWSANKLQATLKTFFCNVQNLESRNRAQSKFNGAASGTDQLCINPAEEESQFDLFRHQLETLQKAHEEDRSQINKLICNERKHEHELTILREQEKMNASKITFLQQRIKQLEEQVQRSTHHRFAGDNYQALSQKMKHQENKQLIGCEEYEGPVTLCNEIGVWSFIPWSKLPPKRVINYWNSILDGTNLGQLITSDPFLLPHSLQGAAVILSLGLDGKNGNLQVKMWIPDVPYNGDIHLPLNGLTNLRIHDDTSKTSPFSVSYKGLYTEVLQMKIGNWCEQKMPSLLFHFKCQ